MKANEIKNPIINAYLNDFIKCFDLPNSNYTESFEHFCNYFILKNRIRTDVELDVIHTGGGDDLGIDGIAIIVNNQLISGMEDLEKIIENSLSINIEMHFIQAKTSDNLDLGEFGSFLNGVSDFLDLDKLEIDVNDKIIEINKLWMLLKDNYHKATDKDPICKLHYVNLSNTDKNDRRYLNRKEKGLNAIRKTEYFPDLSLDLYTKDDIIQKYKLTQMNKEVTIQFKDKVTLPEINSIISKSYLGILPFNEFIKLIRDDNDQLNSVFEYNVRDFQGETTVNVKIENSLKEEYKKNEPNGINLFCILNNGVTIISNRVILGGGDKITLQDYQIVNGCQTSNIIYSCRNIDHIENIFIPVKIIETSDDNVITKITLATNSQTAIKTEQLQSLNNFSRKLEEFFYATKNNITLYFERRSGQYSSKTNKGEIKRVQIISMPEQIKSFTAAFLAEPHSLSGNYGTIINNLDDKIFLESHNLSCYYLSALIFYRLESYFRNRSIDKQYKKLRHYIVMTVKLRLIGLSKKEQLNSRKLDKLCNSAIEYLNNDKHSYDLFRETINILTNDLRIFSFEKDRYRDANDTNKICEYFKNQTPIIS